MKLRNKEILEEFVIKHSDSKNAINRWIAIIEEASWNNHSDLKNEFPTADYVGNSRYIFNIKGNNYRIITVIIFTHNLISVRFIGSHAEYDKIIDCSTI